MWWMTDRGTEQKSAARCRVDARPSVAKSVATIRGSQRRNGLKEREYFRSLRLTPEEQAANLQLGGDFAGKTAEIHSVELKRLIADVAVLETILRDTQAKRNQQQSEMMRLQAECERWLAETRMLSYQLGKEVERRTEIAGRYEIVHEQLQSLRVPAGGTGHSGQEASTKRLAVSDASPDCDQKAA
jgi:hypothetical protein